MYFQPEDNHKKNSQKRKRFKKLQVQTRVENDFSFITHTLPLRKKRFSISGNLFRTSGRTTKVLSCWRYRWLACVLSQVVRTSSPGSRPRQFFPSLPNPGMVSWSSWRNSSTASAEKFSYSFYYNEGLENKLTRAPLLGLAKTIY